MAYRIFLHRRPWSLSSSGPTSYTILVLKLTLVLEIQALLLCRWPPVIALQLSLPVQLSRKAHNDSDHMHGCDRYHLLTLTCRNSPCWRSCRGCNSYQEFSCPSKIIVHWTPHQLQTTRFILHYRLLVAIIIHIMRLIFFFTSCHAYAWQHMVSISENLMKVEILVSPDQKLDADHIQKSVSKVRDPRL